MDEEFVLAGLSAGIWLILAGFTVVFYCIDGSHNDGETKLVKAFVLGGAITAGCFALYLAMTLP